MHYKQSESEHARATPAWHDGDGVFSVSRLFENLPAPARLWIAEVEPGGSEGQHRHDASVKRRVVEVYYCIDGCGTMLIDGEMIPITPGDAVLVPPEASRGFRNTGTEPMKLMVIVGPPPS